MKQKLLLLNGIQFLAALNENFVRMLCAFYVIHLVGKDHASTIMTKTGLFFFLPFILFSTLGGLIADKYCKSRVIQWTRLAEFFGFCLFTSAILLHSSTLSYLALFALATISAIFSPSKYSILPEYVSEDRLIGANSLITAFTFLAIIGGIGLASFLIEITDLHYLLSSIFAIIIAGINIALAAFLPATWPQYPERTISFFYIKEFFLSFIEIKRIPYLLPVTLAYAYFLFLGSFLQFNLIPFSIEILHRSALDGGYLFMWTSIGLALGAGLVTKISRGQVKLLLIPYSGIAISLAMIILAHFSFSLVFTGALLLLLGFFGGIFLIPAITHLLKASPSPTRGRNFSTANLLSIAFALLAPLVIYLLNVKWHLSPDISFTLVALTNLLIMGGFFKALKAHKKAKL